MRKAKRQAAGLCDPAAAKSARARVRAQRSEEAFRADCDAVFENNYPTPAQAAFAAEEFLDTIIKKSKEE